MNAIRVLMFPRRSPLASTVRTRSRAPSFHVKCYENWYLAKHGKQVAGDMSKIHHCPKCAQPKFKRKGGRALEEESVADAEGEKKKAKAKL